MTGSASIQSRVLALVGVGVFVAVGLLSLLSRSSLLALEDQLVADHQRLARTVADALSVAVDDDLSLLATAATAPHIDLADRADDAERAILETAIRHSRLWSSVHFLDETGQLVTSAPSGERVLFEQRPLRDFAASAIRTQRPLVSGVAGAGEQACVLGLVPFRGKNGQAGGAVAGVIRLPAKRLGRQMHATALGAQVHVELLDASNVALWASRTPDGQAIHSPVSAPVDGTPWTLVLSTVGVDPLAPIATFQRRSLWLAPTLASLATLLAWGIARSVRRPIASLTAAAERIASGDLSGEVDAGGRSAGDEIVRLASALEHMRRALAESIDEIERSNRELEERVADRTRELHALNARLEERERLRQGLLRKVISAQEDERKRIARELHDETSQTLAAIGIGVDTALATTGAPETRQRLLDLRQLVHRMHQELQRLIVNLRPSVLDDLGLAAAIGWFVARQLGAAGISVRCELEALDVRLPTEVETALFRAVQEAIVNISRHAQAESVLIQGSFENDAVLIEIEDDGIGFDLASVRESLESMRGVGLTGMRERIEILGGSLQIDSEPDHGTRIVMRVPVAGLAQAPAGGVETIGATDR